MYCRNDAKLHWYPLGTAFKSFPLKGYEPTALLAASENLKTGAKKTICRMAHKLCHTKRTRLKTGIEETEEPQNGHGWSDRFDLDLDPCLPLVQTPNSLVSHNLNYCTLLPAVHSGHLPGSLCFNGQQI